MAIRVVYHLLCLCLGASDDSSWSAAAQPASDLRCRVNNARADSTGQPMSTAVTIESLHIKHIIIKLQSHRAPVQGGVNQ